MKLSTIKQFPHCDSRVLHAPGKCEFCDKHPDWQDLRLAWGIAFTGDTDAMLIIKLAQTGDDVCGATKTAWDGVNTCGKKQLVCQAIAGHKHAHVDGDKMWGDDTHPYEKMMPCPAEFIRGKNCQVWGGNTPKPKGWKG